MRIKVANFPVYVNFCFKRYVVCVMPDAPRAERDGLHTPKAQKS